MTSRGETAAGVIVAACVLAAAAGSSVQHDVQAIGGPARWILLTVLLAFAVGYAASRIGIWSAPRATGFALAAFCGLALTSVLWSVNAHGTLVRALGLCGVVVAVGALAGCVPSSPTLGQRLLDGVLAAAALVAFAGLVYWFIAPSHAAIARTPEYPSRFQGIEQNPNTGALLYSIALPIALSRTFAARSTVARIGFLAVSVGLAASITASGSRGALLAMFVGSLVAVSFAPLAWRVRSALALAVVAATVAAAWISTLPKALPPVAAPTATTSAVNPNAEYAFRLSQEIGNPWWTHRSADSRRSLFNTSVRARAWRGTFDRALGRPLLGYGFGAEQWAFVNRYFAFNSENPENGYLGLFLQLGVAGPTLFLLVVALCIAAGVRARATVPYLPAAIGATAAALAAAVSQSFFHGPGSVAFLAFWIALLLTGVAAVEVSAA